MQGLIEDALRLSSAASPNNRHARPDVDGVLWWEFETGELDCGPNPHGGWLAQSRFDILVRCHI